MADYIDISYSEFREAFETKVKSLRDAALFATIYCAYARVGEVVRSRYSKQPAILKRNVSFTKDHMLLKIRTEKTKSRNAMRVVPSSRKLEGWLHEPIVVYMKQVRGKELFPYSTTWAQKRFEKCFGTQHIHLLRHWACTHCLEGHRTAERLEPHDIARLGGWSDFNMFYKVYGHVTSASLQKRI
jgi:integrase